MTSPCYIDNSPPPLIREIAPGIMAVRGEGRPSKRLRRETARALRDSGDRLGAEREARAALVTFKELGASLDLEATRRLLDAAE